MPSYGRGKRLHCPYIPSQEGGGETKKSAFHTRHTHTTREYSFSFRFERKGKKGKEKKKERFLTGGVIHVTERTVPRLRRREPEQRVRVVRVHDVRDLGRRPEVVVSNHAHKDPDLVEPERLAGAAKPVRERVDEQARVRRRDGGDAAAEERRADDDVGLGRCEEGEIGRRRRVGLAVGVKVPRPVQVEEELSGCGHAEERDAAVERICRSRSQGHAGGYIGQDRRYEVTVQIVFEERYVCRTRRRRLGVFDHGQEGAGELVEKIEHVTGVPSTIDHVVVFLQHHVETGGGFS